jgi:multiple sugar transport system ATP-binding protein
VDELRIENLHKSFGSFKLFEGLSFCIQPLAYVCLLGPSGCGKTTLMRMIAGLDQPDAGHVYIGGNLANDCPPHARDVGLAFQNYALYPHLSVRQNLEFPLLAPIRRGQYARALIDQRVAAIASRLKIEPLLEKAVNQLSGGQQQRVALGRALIRHPRVLLLDEPVTHLDARLRHEMRAELKLLHREMETTTIHVTHDQQEALAVADTIVVIKDGRIEQIGAPLSLYHDPDTAFVAGFLGDPPMSLVAARLIERSGARLLELAGVPVEIPRHLADTAAPASSPELLLGLRPQHVELVAEGKAGAIAATVYSHEMVGRDLQISLRLGSDLVRYRTRIPRGVNIGDRLHLRLKLDGTRLFDRRTGKALRSNRTV